MSLKGTSALVSATFLSVAVTIAAPAGQGVSPPAFAPAPATTATLPPPASPPAFAAPVAATPPGANPFAVPAPAPVAAPPSAPGAPANPFVPAATAPEAPANPNAGAFEIAPQGVPPGGVDERALRYYASTRDLARVGAEIRRLKLLNPDWSPPADLFVTASGVNEQPLWDLYGKGDFMGLRHEIEAMRVRTPGWNPSDALLQKLDDGQARATLGSAATAGNWPGVIAAAQARPTLLVCAEMNVLWQVGEAYARLDNLARAFDLYGYILGNCNDPAERLATWQKASDLLPAEGLTALAAFGRPQADGTSEFDSVRFASLRKAMGEVASGEAFEPVDAAQLAAFSDHVGRSRSAGDAALFGWYYYGQEDWDTAAQWFAAATQIGKDPKFVEGQVLALRGAEKTDEATDLAYRNRKASPEIAKIYVEMVAERLTDGEGETAGAGQPKEASDIAPAELKRFTGFVEAQESALGGQALGWYYFNGDKREEAKAWFEKSVSWEPTEEGVTGLAVLAARVGDRKALAAIKKDYGERFASLEAFDAKMAAVQPPRGRSPGRVQASKPRRSGSWDAEMAKAKKQFDAGNYEAALEQLDEREAVRGKSRDAELMRGWANYHLKRWNEARAVFKRQDAVNSTRDTRFGMGAVSNSQYKMWPE